jgi:hypothetical protein
VDNSDVSSIVFDKYSFKRNSALCSLGTENQQGASSLI